MWATGATSAWCSTMRSLRTAITTTTTATPGPRATRPLERGARRRVRQGMGWNNKTELAATALSLALTISAARADVSYELSAGVSTSDNITRVAVNEVDETLADVGLLLGW